MARTQGDLDSGPIDLPSSVFQAIGRELDRVRAEGIRLDDLGARSDVGFMHFLDDAHRLGLLRTVGPIYQFRHAELHDHLAATYRPHR